MEEAYKVKLDVFEGPLDLLLHLVKINEMEISEIRISEITSQYLDYLRLMESLDLDIAGDFLVMAATLLNIKLRSILPDSERDEDEDEEIDDILTARALMEKLVEYRKFKEAASYLRDQEQHRSRLFIRDVALPRMAQTEPEDDLRVDLDTLIGAFSRVVRFIDARGWHLVTEEEYSVEEKMDLIEKRLEVQPRLELEEFFRDCSSKLEMIVLLLALLELFHRKVLRLDQSEAMGPIYIFRRDAVKGAIVPPPEGPAGESSSPTEARIVDLAPENASPDGDQKNPDAGNNEN
ncbi:segregation/condensation protein A [Candidatus Sumerlaeota bacterium]|nr:segregation/condensation protein A [Candidatus Sumerlaeota bacterium]